MEHAARQVESILAQRNPTCDLSAYVGGLEVCKHMYSLLDADQEVPWTDQPLRYWQKYRFYYQPFEPEVHLVSEPRVSWGARTSVACFEAARFD